MRSLSWSLPGPQQRPHGEGVAWCTCLWRWPRVPLAVAPRSRLVFSEPVILRQLGREKHAVVIADIIVCAISIHIIGIITHHPHPHRQSPQSSSPPVSSSPPSSSSPGPSSAHSSSVKGPVYFFGWSCLVSLWSCLGFSWSCLLFGVVLFSFSVPCRQVLASSAPQLGELWTASRWRGRARKKYQDQSLCRRRRHQAHHRRCHPTIIIIIRIRQFRPFLLSSF